MREKIFWNRGFRFNEFFDEKWINEPMGDEGREVLIPHTVKETPFNCFDESIYQMVSCYQRVFVPSDSWKGRIVRVTFEGAAHRSEVYLNGVQVGEHSCGYSAFTIDITDRLIYGEENILTVRLDSREDLDQPPFGYVIDYMTYGGIYRDVYLTVTDPVYIEDAFYIPEFPTVFTLGLSCSEIAGMRVNGTLKTKLRLSAAAKEALKAGRLTLSQSIRRVGNHEEKDARVLVRNGIFSSENIQLSAGKVALWDIKSPALYEAVTTLKLDGEPVDSFTANIGFREAFFEADGFYLNGRKLRIRGLDRHQCFPYVGYAMPESMQRRDADILKDELRVNAVRTSHYPQSHYFIDECDRKGLLVFTEMPGWQHIGGEAWKDIAVQNTIDMVEQYRNHPSIILWGVRINESKDDDEFYARTNAAAHRLDPTRQTGGVRSMKADRKTNIQEDVMTYNDFVHSGENEGCLPKH
ncbi:MAG: glycoside hydrolase family 2 protein, partial [Lachnospiraceae bacterium]|nr:glycoside hydrolase family 2 protein [Lachnospiraceae bacterium]